MYSKSLKVFTLLAIVVAVVSFTEAHKKFYQSAPLYQEPHDQCICDCGRPQPVLPSKPFYGNTGYHQSPPRPSGGGYGNAGAYAISGSYGSGGGQTSGGY